MPVDEQNYSADAVNKQSQAKRYVTQVALVEQIKQYPGYTVAQNAWRFIGNQIDADGQCQPVSEFANFMRFFNAVRRGGEVTRGKNPKVVKGVAVRNPHADAAGLYPADYNNKG